MLLNRSANPSAPRRLVNTTPQRNPSCPAAAALYESLHAVVRLDSQSVLSPMWPTRHGHHFALLSLKMAALHARRHAEALLLEAEIVFLLYLIEDELLPDVRSAAGLSLFPLWVNMGSLMSNV